MKRVVSKHKRVLMVLGLVLLGAALVWAAAELSGQANSLAQDSGSNSADMEMLSVDTIKPPQKTKNSPKPPPCNWGQEKNLRGKIKANDNRYKGLRSKAKSEMNGAGKVSSGTKSAVRSSAKEYKGLNDQYASMWDSCNCKTRAKLARKSGASRIKSAEVLIADEIDSGLLGDMQDAQDEMKSARSDYVAKANEGGELSEGDRSNLNSTVVPQAKSLLTQVQTFSNGVTKLLGDVKSGATGGGLKGLTSMVKGAKEGGASSLLKPVSSLANVAKSMLSGVKALISDAVALATGKMSGAASGMTGKVGGMCFIETAADAY